MREDISISLDNSYYNYKFRSIYNGEIYISPSDNMEIYNKLVFIDNEWKVHGAENIPYKIIIHHTPEIREIEKAKYNKELEKTKKEKEKRDKLAQFNVGDKIYGLDFSGYRNHYIFGIITKKTDKNFTFDLYDRIVNTISSDPTHHSQNVYPDWNKKNFTKLNSRFYSGKNHGWGIKLGNDVHILHKYEESQILSEDSYY